MESVLFYVSAVIAVLTTGMVILSKNAVYAVLYLILSLFAISIVFFTLGAPFIAVLEVIVYAGAIMVLFLFVVMMLNLGSASPAPDLQRPSNKLLILPGLLALALLVETIIVLTHGGTSGAGASAFVVQGPREIGMSLYGRHYLGVELASLVLLIGVIGGMHLGLAAQAEEPEAKSVSS